VTVFYQRDQRSEFEDLLRQYAVASPKFSYEFYNLDGNPGKATQYGVTTYGATVIEYEGKKKVYPYCTEDNITNGILSLSQKKTRKIYFLQGHEENNPEDSDKRKGYSTIASDLSIENYESKPFLLLQEKSVPADAALLVISGPKRDLTEGELTLISDYLEKGGKALFMVDPFTAPALGKFLTSFGIILGNDMVVDQESIAYGGDFLSPVIASYRKHEITRNFKGATIMPLIQSVDVNVDPTLYSDIIVLAKSSPGSYAKTDRTMIEKGILSFDREKDRKGPVPVIAIAALPSKKDSSETTRIAVFGGSMFVNNMYVNLLGNKDLFLNTVNWLVGEEKLISIRPKGKQQLYPFSFLFLTDRQMHIIFWTSVVIQPALIFIIGLIVYVRRRIRG
jgi:ABC-type uncharacterized transport system involved in gliding motility auxiliary subunit